jgi:ribonucleotide monophosphatase NagD (HAD superfamily)
VFGKPNALFYEMAVQTVASEAGNVIMVGDDVETDVLGAEVCGLNGVLVQTGKFRLEQVAGRADQITMIEDVSKLPDLL